MGNAAAKLDAPASHTLELSDGATASAVDGALEVHDKRGVLLVRYVDGTAEIHAPDKLSLSAATVRIAASERLEVSAPDGELVLGRAQLVARHVSTTATTMAHAVERYQLTAGRVVERAHDAFREVSGLFQSRIGRARTVVDQEHHLRCKRNVMLSEEDTTIDGERILLG